MKSTSCRFSSPFREFQWHAGQAVAVATDAFHRFTSPAVMFHAIYGQCGWILFLVDGERGRMANMKRRLHENASARWTRTGGIFVLFHSFKLYILKMLKTDRVFKWEWRSISLKCVSQFYNSIIILSELHENCNILRINIFTTYTEFYDATSNFNITNMRFYRKKNF